jgi:hypothetical protein
MLALAALSVIGAVLAGPAIPASKDGRTLDGNVGPGFTISLSQDGHPLAADGPGIRPGTYWLTVTDQSAIHNFHIFGPGLDETVTTVPFKGTVTLKIQLEHGTYTFQCDPHRTVMHGSFDVGGVGQVG